MCMRDLLETLRRAGITVSESKVRWAITCGRIDRPPLDGSLRFVFDEHHVAQLKRVFGGQESKEAC